MVQELQFLKGESFVKVASSVGADHGVSAAPGHSNDVVIVSGVEV